MIEGRCPLSISVVSALPGPTRCGLPDELVERAWPHPRREGGVGHRRRSIPVADDRSGRIREDPRTWPGVYEYPCPS